MKTQLSAKRDTSVIGPRSQIPISNHASPDISPDSSINADQEDFALHPSKYNLANLPITAKSSGNYQQNTIEGSASRLPIQAKLTIAEPNDKYEQEADRISQQVVHWRNLSYNRRFS